jgi:hypothetical protein
MTKRHEAFPELTEIPPLAGKSKTQSAHRYKQRPSEPSEQQRPRGYHPVAAVRERGDSWRLAIPYSKGGEKDLPGAVTIVALRDQTFDSHEMFEMTLMERGVIARCEFIWDDE